RDQTLRADVAEQLEAVDGGLGRGELDERLAQVVVDGERRVRGGVDAAGDAGLDTAERDRVGDPHGGGQARAAGLLSGERRGGGASEVVSTAPATPDSIRTSAIASATCTAEARPVPQACCRSNAGVEASRTEPITVSRVRLKSRECLSTAPATTMPRASPWRLYRAARPAMAAVSMSGLDASAYLPLDRAKGIRLPPTMATLRGLVVTCVTPVVLGVRWPATRPAEYCYSAVSYLSTPHRRQDGPRDHPRRRVQHIPHLSRR